MPTIFISYRHADSMESTGRIFDWLVEYLADVIVFRDIDSIPLGASFPDVLQEALSRADAVIAVIGPSWSTIPGSDGSSRLANRNDFVRLEIETAFKLGVPVIPVLVLEAKMPSEDELPASIRQLASQQCHSVRPGSDFRRDVDALCTKLRHVLKLPESAIRRSEAVEGMVGELQRRFREMKAESEHRRELDIIDREWEEQREKYKLRYGENGVPRTPTLAITVLHSLAALIAIPAGAAIAIAAFVSDNGVFLPFILVLVLAAGVVAPIYYVVCYVKYKKVEKMFRERREAARQRYERQLNSALESPKSLQ